MSTINARKPAKTNAAELEKLALLGGPKAVTDVHEDMFHWPIITKEDETAVLQTLRTGRMSNLDVTLEFEKEFAAWIGLPFALAHCNGTAALQAAMYACGVRRCDEVICPSMTYWASGLPAFTLGGVPVWADVQPDTLCLDPESVKKVLSPRTKAIVVVHYAGYPADMDPIMELANARGIKVIEDVSHAHGGRYKGRMLGTIGHVAAMSMMSMKSFAIGEGGMLVTADRAILERAITWGHYERTGRQGNFLTLPDMLTYAGLPLGAVKGRLNQLASSLGRTQLKHYDKRNAEILKCMDYFWDKLEGTPGLRAHRPAPDSGSAMGGWYSARGLYRAEELGGLPIARFCEAVTAEGFECVAGSNFPLHLHPLCNEADIYGDGKPTILAQATRDTRAPKGSLPASEATATTTYNIPWFKHYRPKVIHEYITAFRKVCLQADQLR